MYSTRSLNSFYDRQGFDSLMKAARFSMAKAIFAKTDIDVYYVGPKGRLRVVAIINRNGELSISR